MNSEDRQPIVVASESGEVLDKLNIRHKLTDSQTGGAYYLFDSEFGPGHENRMHVHRYEDEVAFVLEGALTIRLQDQILDVGAGGVAFLPKGIPHAIRNPLDTASKYLFAAIPGRSLERCFEEVQAAASAGELDAAGRSEIFLRYGIEFLD